ncbi:MAG TPA: hypothetical protein VFO52_06755 [Longimicrobiales bacterium]|nr:hypothetical protein [Longimicrobiales bacterium]
MKLLLVIYSGSQSELVPELFDQHQAGGYTQLGPVHGAGATGKRAGSRAWPGNASVYFSIVPAERVDAFMDALRTQANKLVPGERLHAAVLPTETFF